MEAPILHSYIYMVHKYTQHIIRTTPYFFVTDTYYTGFKYILKLFIHF